MKTITLTTTIGIILGVLIVQIIACVYAPHVKATELPPYVNQYVMRGELISSRWPDTMNAIAEWDQYPPRLRIILQDPLPEDLQPQRGVETYATTDGLAFRTLVESPLSELIKHRAPGHPTAGVGTFFQVSDTYSGMGLWHDDPELIAGWNLPGRADLVDWDRMYFTLNLFQQLNPNGNGTGYGFTAHVDGFSPRFSGDANDDLAFTSDDLIQIFQVGKYETNEPASWREGDFNFDSVFDSADLTDAFRLGWYDQPASPAAVAVPEPSTGQMLLFTGIVVVCILLAVKPIKRRD